MQKELTTLFTGQQREDLDKVDSTNSYLSELLKKSRIPEGFVVSSLSQEVGRGQTHAKWKSETGKNLLLSFAFYPTFLSLKDIFHLNKCFTLAVSDMLRNLTGEEIHIKWPNDVYYKSRKICGILIENSINSSGIQHTILGIGLNVNQDDFPKDVPNPTSLKLILGKEIDREIVLAELCISLEKRYLQLKRGQYSILDVDFEAILYRKDEWHFFQSERTAFEGMIKGVDSRGRLLVRLKNDLEKFFDLREIKYLK